MLDFYAFSDELVKIASDQDRREKLRAAAQHSAAAILGTGLGIGAGNLLVRQLKKNPELDRLARSRAAKYGIPGLAAAGSIYASHKYKKNVEDAFRRLRDKQ